MKRPNFQTDVLPLKDELYRLALHITLDHAEAQDVVQETMLKVWSRRQQWDEITSMQAFCLTVCRNLALDRNKRADSHNLSLTTAHEGATSREADVADTSYAANPEEQAVQRDRVELVRRLMQQLPEKQRTCMHLRDIEGRSYRDIADVMGITEQQVKVNIFRARQAVKQKFLESEQYGL